MLRTDSRMRPTPRSLRACLAFLVAISIPGLAQAFSTTSILTDAATGLSISATFDDGLEPGSIVVSLDITSSPALGASLTGFAIEQLNVSAPALFADGDDVFDSGYFPTVGPPATACPCYLIVDIGLNGFFDPTGISSTSIEVFRDSVPLSLVDLQGASFFLAASVPVGPSDQLVKLRGEIPVIPEPTIAAMMLLGLIGLAGGSNRVARNAA